ncbi:formin homology 2 domain-containing family protein [Raphanus sativus]|nr:formin homology 2 domain-containing family protein [Raphanus sativus]
MDSGFGIHECSGIGFEISPQPQPLPPQLPQFPNRGLHTVFTRNGQAAYFTTIYKVCPSSFKRLQPPCHHSRYGHPHRHNNVKIIYTIVHNYEACTELKSSILFLKVLEAVLKTGNMMNVGTIGGGAKAFRLGALLKLSMLSAQMGRELYSTLLCKGSDSIMG